MSTVNTIKITNLSKIELGTSLTNEKEYMLDFQLSLKSIEILKILTYPFSSNKMRFQYPDMFCYKIVHTHDTFYKLTVTRYNKPNCQVTSNFFPEFGWTINLHISIKIKYEPTKIFTMNDILFMLPNEYGTIFISDNFKFKKNGIIMPLFGRYEYVKKCLESLVNTNLTECTLVLIDESLTKDLDDDKIKTNMFIKNFTINNVNIIKIFKNKHGNMHDSILIGLDILEQHCDMLMTIDSDTLHKKDFIDITLNLHNKLSLQHKNVLVTGFNTPNHETVHIESNNNDYVLKKTIGGCHLCFSSKTYNLLRFGLVSNKWDTNVYHLINNNNGIIASTIPSVVEHIGEISSVRQGGRYDRTVDFTQS